MLKTTTDKFQTKPDFYNNIQDCKKDKYSKKQTNERYKMFKQKIFTAGDKEQFLKYLLLMDGYDKNINIDSNVFRYMNNTFNTSLYKDINSDCLFTTFDYIFNKFKKGIYIKIQNNNLVVFLPFSKANFINEWYDKIKVCNNASFKFIDFNFENFKNNNIIKFYSGSKDKLHAKLSNFALIKVQIEERVYISGEHAFHGEKYLQISKHISNEKRQKELIDYSLKFQGMNTSLVNPIDAKRAGGKGEARINSHR